MKVIRNFWGFLVATWLEITTFIKRKRRKEPSITAEQMKEIKENVKNQLGKIRKNGNLILWEFEQTTGEVKKAEIRQITDVVTEKKADTLIHKKGKIYVWSLNLRNAKRNLQNQGFITN